MNQPKLFEQMTESVALENVLLYALGDFQARGKVLVGREVAFDRLRGAFLRAFAQFGIAEPLDDSVADSLRNLGVKVTEVPSFVAKHPFRVIVSKETALLGANYFKQASSEKDMNLVISTQ